MLLDREGDRALRQRAGDPVAGRRPRRRSPSGRGGAGARASGGGAGDARAAAGSSHTSVAVRRGLELAVRVCALEHPVLAAAVVLRDVRRGAPARTGAPRPGRRPGPRAAHAADGARRPRRGAWRDRSVSAELAATLKRQVAKLRVFAEELEELAGSSPASCVCTRRRRTHRRSPARSSRTCVVARRAPVSRSPHEGGPARLRTDPVRLAQVLSNLVDNGIRYNRRGGRVTVRTAPAEGGVRIDVEDDGVGIPAAELGWCSSASTGCAGGPRPRGQRARPRDRQAPGARPRRHGQPHLARGRGHAGHARVSGLRRCDLSRGTSPLRQQGSPHRGASGHTTPVDLIVLVLESLHEGGAERGHLRLALRLLLFRPATVLLDALPSLAFLTESEMRFRSGSTESTVAETRLPGTNAAARSPPLGTSVSEAGMSAVRPGSS